MHELLADLAAEEEALDGAIAPLATDVWDRPSPAAGWTLRDCVAHLAEAEEIASEAVETRLPPIPPGQPEGSLLTERQLRARERTPLEVLDWWRQQRHRLLALLAPLAPGERLPWAVGAMSARSFAAARIMETWSHGLDILDAAGIAPVDTDRLFHVAELGHRARDFAYRNRGLTPPSTPLHVELVAPSGASWTFGPADAPDQIAGSAGEFCRVVTRRLHRLDTSLQATGPHAEEYLALAQVYAGPPGSGRPPRNVAPASSD